MFAQGTMFSVNGVQYAIDYAGGDGNDVVLTFVNAAPIANDDAYSLPEYTPSTPELFVPASAGVLQNDVDPNGDQLAPVLDSPPTNGTLWLFTDGSFRYQPAAGFSGVDTFTYHATDGTLNSNTVTVSLYVNQLNQPPVANPDSYSAVQGVALAIAAPGVLANDFSFDVPPDMLTADLLGSTTHGSLTLNMDGSFTYTPDANFIGQDQFTYRAFDPAMRTSMPTTVTINVGVNNMAPTVNDDTFSMSEDNTLFVVGPGVLANDSDPNNDTLSAFLVDGPSHGMLTLGGDGSITYTPNPNYNGQDTFTYRATDGQLASAGLATVTITINPVNDAPVGTTDNYNVDEDTLLTVAAPGVLTNDTDVDGDTLTAVLVNGPQHTSNGGSFTLNADGSFTYQAGLNFNGTDFFTYRAVDSGTPSLQSDVTTVFINVNAVNDAPVAMDDTFSVNEDATLTIAAPGVLFNDNDPDGNLLSAVLMDAPMHGSLTLNSDGSFTYIPTANYNGQDTFTYVASDGKLNSGLATVTITINPVNDAPVGTTDNYNVDEDTLLTVPAPGVLTNDTDVDGDTLTAVLVNGPQHTSNGGSFTLNADGSFTYQAGLNFNGTDFFTYRAVDSGTPSLQSDVTTVFINVNAVNDPPVAVDDTYATNEDVPLVISAPGVLQNDTDADGDKLTAVQMNGPSHGSVVLNSDGSFTYTPNANYNGPDSFTYVANDGQALSTPATVNITVNAVADAPTALDDSYTLSEDTKLTVNPPGVLLNDLNPDGNPLTIVVVNGPHHAAMFTPPGANGGFEYQAVMDYHGPDSFTYYLLDPMSGLTSNLATVSLTVLPVNDPPVAVDDTFSTNEDVPLFAAAPGVLQNDTDADGDKLSAVLMNGPTHGSVTLNSDGSFTYTPNTNFNGVDTFTYKANDGQSLSMTAATVTITVNAVADAPTAVDDSYTGLEDTKLTVAAPGLLLNDLNPDGNALNIIVVNGPQYAASFTVNNDGSFTYMPQLNYDGPDSFTYFLKDPVSGLTSNLATVSLTILPVNDAPVAHDDFYSTNEDVPLSVAAPGVLQNDTDPSHDTLSAVLMNGPTHGSVTLNSNGSFVYTPDANFNGQDTFTYKADDGQALSNVATVHITVNPVNDAPVALDNTYTTPEDQNLIVPAPGILGNDYDLDSATIGAILVNPPQFGTLSLALNGAFLYAPNPNFSGTDTFTYKAHDGQLFSNLATVTIHVTEVAETTVKLDASSDTGVSNSDGITKDTTPTFSGTTVPNLPVYLYGRPAGTNQVPGVIGQTVADSSGNYSITSIPLANGQYEFFVQAFRPDGRSTGLVNAGLLTIDTASPVVTNAILNPQTGQIEVTFQDERSGMAQPTLTNLNNYTFVKQYTGAPRAFAITNAQPLPITGPTVPQTVVLDSSAGRPIQHGRYLFAVLASGVTDVAGNALDGEFNGYFPTGNGVAGGDFNAQFQVDSRGTSPALPTNEPIPVITGPAQVSQLVIPAGPVGQFHGQYGVNGVPVHQYPRNLNNRYAQLLANRQNLAFSRRTPNALQALLAQRRGF